MARAVQAVTDKPLTCVNALRPHLRQENNIRHEGRYRHVETTFNPSDPDLYRSHCAATGIRSATSATSRSAPRVLWARALASYVGRWLRLALLVDVPTDDAMHDCHSRRHLFSRPWFLRPWVSSLGATVADVGCDPSHSALQILNERFARGEIQKDEYAEKKAAILSGG